MPVVDKKLLKIFTFVIGLSGLFMIFLVLQPIISYEITARKKFPTLISPIVEGGDKNLKTYLEKNPDLKKANNWFVGDSVNDDNITSEKKFFYNISIPKLKIDKALVSMGGEDLSKSLIQYPGTAIPGQVGNSVIFGHSVLPIFFNPKNYLSIFSTLPRIDIGNEIMVEYDNVNYKFVTESVFEVLPTDIQILEQNSSGSYITLVTCTPPGHPLKPKRLIVRAKLNSNN